MTSNFNVSKQDPDYDEVIATPESFRRQDEEKLKRENSIRKIKEIIERQFDGELQAKEEEVLNIEKKISQTKFMLDQLRAYLLANYYGCNGKVIKGHVVEKKRKERKQNRANLKKADSSERVSQVEERTDVENNWSESSSAGGNENSKVPLCSAESSTSSRDVKNVQSTEHEAARNDGTLGNRFYVKKDLIVGNISKFIPIEKRDKNDQATHKWMVYVRGPPSEPDLSSFIQRVWFILHPSYMPNDIIEVARPPFTVTKRGWGEFPVRIQLVFNDPRNKPVDIIHSLKLDKTYTGLQTLGAETKIAIELQRHTIDEKSDKDTLKTAPDLCVLSENAKSFAGSDVAPPLNYSEADILPSGLVTTEKDIVRATEMYPQTLNESCSNPNVVKGPLSGLFGEATEEKCSFEVPRTKTDSCATPPSLNSRICSPVPYAHKEKTSQLESFVHEALLKNISHFPLICAERDIAKLHYCAKTIQQYSGWSFSKRRASEWQRALDVKRYMSKIGISDDLTTKKVFLWCREHGYTPAEKDGLVICVEDLDHCPMCGKCFPCGSSKGIDFIKVDPVNSWCSSCLSNLSLKHTSTLTSFEEFISGIATQEGHLRNLKETDVVLDDSDDMVIDVVGTESAENGENFEELIDRDSIEPTQACSLTDWIFEAAAQIEVDLKSVTLHGRKVPVLQQLLLNAMKCFVRDILAQSYAHAKSHQSSLDPVVITPIHVIQALKLIDHMDFLTNNFFGVHEEDGNV